LGRPMLFCSKRPSSIRAIVAQKSLQKLGIVR
jgi:hypothetical protein